MSNKNNSSNAEVDHWNLPHLQKHLQYAVDFEFWTIPYYMTAMYSLKRPGSEAFKLIQSICFQEMLHVQLAANIANAFGVSPTFRPPRYGGQNIPHLNFALESSDPTEKFSKYSAALGPLDEIRLHTMCLIEYPEWPNEEETRFDPDITRYGGIGHFYEAIRHGIEQHKGDIKPNVNQVDLFGNYYPNLPEECNLTITAKGGKGVRQALELIDIITEQGEGLSSTEQTIPSEYRNGIDDPFSDIDHYGKFKRILELPASEREYYDAVAKPAERTEARKAQEIYASQFTVMCKALEAIFNGENSDDFGQHMATTGAMMANCWRVGAIPLPTLGDSE